MSKLQALGSLFKSIPAGLGKAGKGAASVASYGIMGDSPAGVRRMMSTPGVDYKKLRNLSLAGQGIGFLGFPLLAGLRKDIMGPTAEDYAMEDQARERAFQHSLGKLGAASARKQAQLNESILARKAPNLYNKILAGRPLPAGAVVIGGGPRRDLMQELANAMSAGAFTPNQGDQDVAISDLL